MIPKAFITEWTQFAPWKTNEQVEQDLLISRVLVEIFSDEYLSGELAFRGGTALHKLFLLPQSRYSEDIDLVQISEGPIGVLLDRIHELLDPVFESKAKYKKTLISNKLIYRFQSEFPPIQNMRLKIEINCREHFSALGLIKVPFEVNSRWYRGKCDITTYQIEELMGTKLRALFQRSKGRDLYDQHRAIIILGDDLDLNKLIHCYRIYMEQNSVEIPSKESFIRNLKEKMQNPQFIGDTVAILPPNTEWNAFEAFEELKDAIFEKL